MMKKGIAVLAAGLMLAGSLTGCGKGNTLDGNYTPHFSELDRHYIADRLS